MSYDDWKERIKDKIVINVTLEMSNSIIKIHYSDFCLQLRAESERWSGTFLPAYDIETLEDTLNSLIGRSIENIEAKYHWKTQSTLEIYCKDEMEWPITTEMEGSEYYGVSLEIDIIPT